MNRINIVAVDYCRREFLIDVAVVGCVLAAYYSPIDRLLFDALCVPAFAALIANLIVHNRLRRRRSGIWMALALRRRAMLRERSSRM